MPEYSNWRWNPVTKKVEYSPTTPNYVAETFAAQQRQRQVQNNLQWTQDALDSVNATAEGFQQSRRDLGIYTEEEKEAARLAAIEQTQEELSDLDWNSEDAEGIYRSFASPEDIRTMEIAKGVGTTVATLPFTAGTMGWVPALTTTATGAAGGYAGAYGGQKLGQYFDNKYGWNTTPWLTTIGGIGGGILGRGLGYKGTVNLGSHGLLPKGGQIMYGKQFVTDVASNALNRNVMQINPALTYGTVKYYGPTMGKTTAAKTNPNLVDFDDYVRGDLDALASQLGMTRQQLMMSQDPTIRENARQLMLKSIEEWRQNPSSYGKTLVISKSDVLQDPIFDNQPLVLQRSEFLKRNAARGETNLQNSMDWYASTRRKGGNKLMEWPDPEGVYISELEPFTPDPHHITFTPQSSKGSYVWFERPSKLTWEERLGIPKGERNQPGKPRSYRAIEYDIIDGLPTKEFLDDFNAYVEALKTGGRRVDITDMFDSPWYKQRLLNQGLTEEQANQLILRLKDRIDPDNLIVVDGLHSIRDFSRIEDGFPVEMTPERLTVLGRHTTGSSLSGKSLIELSTKADPEEIILHEIGGHRSQPLVADFKDAYLNQGLTNLGRKRLVKVGADDSYGLAWDEVRARALTIAKQMSDAGWNPNSSGQVNVWLNKHIFTNGPKNANQGALYYYRPRFIKAVTTGLKQGGKIENPDHNS